MYAVSRAYCVSYYYFYYKEIYRNRIVISLYLYVIPVIKCYYMLAPSVYRPRCVIGSCKIVFQNIKFVIRYLLLIIYHTRTHQ